MTQTEANRSNAQLSTGPRTGAGKARSSLNAATHGIYARSEIIRGEDPAALQALEADYLARHKPADCNQMVQVKIMVRAEWELDRLSRAEAQLWEHALALPGEDLQENSALGQAFSLKEHTFARLGRRQDATHRAYEKALHELERLQSLPAEPPDLAPPPTPAQPPSPEPQPQPEPAESKPPTPEMASFRQPAPPPPSPPPAEPIEAPKPQIPHPLSKFNPKNPDHPPIELCPYCRERGIIGDRCYFRPRKRP